MQHEDNNKYLQRASFWVVIENIVKVLEPVLVMSCLKVFGGGEWGAFKVFEAILLIGMRLTCLGLERGLIWYQAQCDEAAHRRAFWQAVSLMVVFAGVLVGGVAGLRAAGLDVLPEPSKYGLPSMALPLFAMAMLAQALMYPATQFLVSRRVLHFNMLSRFVALPVGVYGGSLLFRALGVGTLAIPMAYLVGSLLSMVVAFAGVFYYVPGIWRSFTWHPTPPRSMLRFSLIISSSEIAMAMAARLDIYLLTTHFGLKAVEVYTTLVMIVNALRTIRQSFDNIMLGLFSRMAKAADSLQSLIQAYQQANGRVMTLHLPVMVALIAYGDRLLEWLLPHGGNLQLTLALGLLLVFFTTPTALGLQWQVGLGRSWMMPVGQVFFVSANAGLNLLLIPRYGVTGGIVASGMAQICGGLPAWILTFSQTGWTLFGKNFWKPLFPSAIWPIWLALHFVINNIWLDASLFILLLGLYYWNKKRVVSHA